jgi:hypothetical protein
MINQSNSKPSMLKRAVVFTLISSLFATLFIVLFSYDFQTIFEDVTSASNMRIRVMDTYVKNFESYIGGSLRVSTYRTLDSIYTERLANGSPFRTQQDFNYTFVSCMSCGYTNCTSMSKQCNGSFASFMNNITFSALSNLNINTSYRINSITLYQTYPFDVEVSLDISYNVSDNINTNFSSWARRVVINETISIIGLKDPLVGLKSYNNRSIKQNTVCLYQSCWNKDTAKVFFDNKEYRHYPNGSSYLQRFWNITAISSCCGLETFLDSTIANYSTFNSYVDIYYWTGQYNCTNINFTGLPGSLEIIKIDYIAPDFKLDSKTAARFSLTSDGVLVCPISP